MSLQTFRLRRSNHEFLSAGAGRRGETSKGARLARLLLATDLLKVDVQPYSFEKGAESDLVKCEFAVDDKLMQHVRTLAVKRGVTAGVLINGALTSYQQALSKDLPEGAVATWPDNPGPASSRA